MEYKKENEGVLPAHVGIILDGNGRWAQARGESRTRGHIAGSENVVTITRECSNLGVRALSLYAFSTENWSRPAGEVRALMQLLIDFIKTYLDELNENNVRLITMGDISRLPLATRTAVGMALRTTQKNTGMVLNIGLNYGGRDEILRAVRRAYDAGVTPEELSEEQLSAYLDTSNLPPLDLVIRTAGEQRLSNFMIWQAAYAEFVFTPTLWPDFSVQDLHDAFHAYGKRKRRFGGLG